LIDLHTHLHPPRLFTAIRRWFADRSTWKLDHQPSEPADVAAVLRANGVERFVFCSYAHRTGMARELNAWLAQTSRDLGGYGLPLATVHLDDPDYVDDFETARADGCIGIKIHEDVQRLRVDDPRFDAVYERLGVGGFVLAHVGPIPWSEDPGAPARVERVVQRHPQLRFIVAHMGGEIVAKYIPLLSRYPNLYLDTTMAFAAESPMTLTIDPSLVEAHAGQIVYGTDFPNIPYAYDSELRAIDALGLSAASRNAIVRENALRLIGAKKDG
jgi:predicted TIM-barrel fold metal-dependent hydrolase